MSERNGAIELPSDEECDVVIRVGTAAVTADLYELHDLFIQLGHKHGAGFASGDTAGYYAEARAAMASRGLPDLRARQVAALRDEVYNRVESLAKKGPAPSNSATPEPAGPSGSGLEVSPQGKGTGSLG